MSDTSWLDTLLMIVGLLATLVVLVSFVWRSWALLTEDDVNLMSVVAVLSPCLCFLPLFVIKYTPRTRKPDMILAGGFVVTLLCAYPASQRDDARRKAEQAAREETTRNAALERAARTPSKLGAGAPGAPPQPVVVPEMGGKSVDLSSIMGRARALANGWQPEAALLGIEANGLTRGLLQTDAGGSATLIFGPPPFGDPGAKTGTFVVTYDKTGLAGAASTVPGGKPLVEPMCAPERVYDLAAGNTGASITLRYARDAQGTVAWLASDPQEPKQKPKAFDAQTCTQLQRR